MNEKEYLWKIEQLIHSIDNINEEMLDVLSLFIFHNHLSIYQIHKIIAKHGKKKIAYKNSRQKVQKLIDLKLIEKEIDISKFQIKELEKGAIYYRLSEEGIFVLFYYSNVVLKPSIYYIQRAFEHGKTVEDMSNIFAEYKKEIFKNHQDSTFFELFLFPWISKETIESADEKLINYIITSLNDCCTIIKNFVLKTSPPLYMPNDIDTVSYLFSEIMDKRPILGIESVNTEDQNLLSFIEDFFFERHTIVRIKRNGKNNILLTSSFYPDRMILTYKDKENRSNVISFYKNTEGNSLFNYSLKHKQISDPMFDLMEQNIDLESLYFKALFSIVMRLSKNDNELKLLKEDVKFMDALSTLKERF